MHGIVFSKMSYVAECNPIMFVCAELLSHAQLFVTPWTVSCQSPLSMEFSRQEYWNELLFPTPGDLPNLRTEPVSPALAGRFFTTGPPWKLQPKYINFYHHYC